MKCLTMFALAVYALFPAVLRADEWVASGPVVVHKNVELIDYDFAREERIRQWQAELAAREFETARAQTAWLPAVKVGPIEEAVVRDRPTFSNALVAVNRPYGFVPEPLYQTPNADRRSFAYRWSPYVFIPAPVVPAAVAPATVGPATSWQPNYYVGYGPGSVQVVGPRTFVPRRAITTPDIVETVPVTASRDVDLEIR